ncbi:LOW QUALITY PROTEIN: TNFRSF12A isoform 2 [Pongo abelii]|uniref:TNFRSF12A isoform 2 n=1 Tax=Pongo abelii TaxID=9601 RepID=A0A2J8S7Z1_PONAB|nr:LOW QUALITY PROTEIN: TNFRSF12A isoform 2 [Pongo abelii]
MARGSLRRLLRLLMLGLWLALLRSVAGEQAPGTRDSGIGEPQAGAREPDWVSGEQRGTGGTGGCGDLGSGGLQTTLSRLWELPSLSKLHSQSGPQFLPPSNWGWGSSVPKVRSTSNGERKRCGTSCPLPAALAHPWGRSEPDLRARAAFWLSGLETMPQEREVHHPHRGDRRRGLPSCGADPVTMCPLPAGAHPLIIHSSILEPVSASQTRQEPSSSNHKGGGGR